MRFTIGFYSPNSPIGEWMEFSRHYLKNAYEKNWDKILLVGCFLLNQAAKVVLNDIYKTPLNMFLALIGKPGSGKSTVMSTLQAIIEDTYIQEIPTGSAEAIEEEIQKRKHGILFWDEAGELSDKSSSYLSRVKYVLNRAYYLQAIVRSKVTKASVYIPSKTYYVSVVFGALPQQWKELVSQWLGGFERRVLPLNFKKTRKPFDERPQPSDKALEYMMSLQAWINALEPYTFCVSLPDMRFLQEDYERWNIPDELETQIEEYTYAVTASFVVNDLLSTLGVENLRELQHQPSLWETKSSYIEIEDVRECKYEMADVEVILKLVDSDEASEWFEDLAKSVLHMVVRNALALPEVEEDEMFKLISRLEELKSKGIHYMKMKDFVRKVLGTRNADYYRPRVEALLEAEYIRIIRNGRSKYVLFDFDAEICVNCKYLAYDQSSRSYYCSKFYNSEDARHLDFDPFSEACSGFVKEEG